MSPFLTKTAHYYVQWCIIDTNFTTSLFFLEEEASSIKLAGIILVISMEMEWTTLSYKGSEQLNWEEILINLQASRLI